MKEQTKIFENTVECIIQKQWKSIVSLVRKILGTEILVKKS